jgi:hypothetical protein
LIEQKQKFQVGSFTTPNGSVKSFSDLFFLLILVQLAEEFDWRSMISFSKNIQIALAYVQNCMHELIEGCMKMKFFSEVRASMVHASFEKHDCVCLLLSVVINDC